MYSRLLADKDSAIVNDEVELTVAQATCNYSNWEITESDWQPVENAEIILEDDSWFTGADGKVKILLENSPPVTFYSANNAVLVKEKVTTSAKISEFSQLKVYPNPVKNLLTIDAGGNQNYNLQLTNLNGKVLTETQNRFGFMQIDMELYSPGIYFLHISRNGKTGIFKIIKK